ncbi:hypothetical protein BDQ17DRAFT_1320349 [Cyathus striatus]|nr:hypothetical protein BDQ17DRAFT_1320349 [Cyathus striatus]
MQRSKSAPQTITGLYWYCGYKTWVLVRSGRIEKEEAFNLKGFFPASLRTEEGAWQWLRGGDDYKEREEGEGEGTEEGKGEIGLFGGEEKATGEAIRKEDKLGLGWLIGGWDKGR